MQTGSCLESILLPPESNGTFLHSTNAFHAFWSVCQGMDDKAAPVLRRGRAGTMQACRQRRACRSCLKGSRDLLQPRDMDSIMQPSAGDCTLHRSSRRPGSQPGKACGEDLCIKRSRGGLLGGRDIARSWFLTWKKTCGRTLVFAFPRDHIESVHFKICEVLIRAALPIMGYFQNMRTQGKDSHL